jgi:hypothetical protein
MTFDCLIVSKVSKCLSLPRKQQFPYCIFDECRSDGHVTSLLSINLGSNRDFLSGLKRKKSNVLFSVK